jgi:hypothetical protein
MVAESGEDVADVRRQRGMDVRPLSGFPERFEFLVKKLNRLLAVWGNRRRRATYGIADTLLVAFVVLAVGQQVGWQLWRGSHARTLIRVDGEGKRNAVDLVNKGKKEKSAALRKQRRLFFTTPTRCLTRASFLRFFLPALTMETTKKPGGSNACVLAAAAEPLLLPPSKIGTRLSRKTSRSAFCTLGFDFSSPERMRTCGR